MIGGRPIQCDENGNEIPDDKNPDPVTKYKDNNKKIKRQAAKFRIYRHSNANEPDEIVTPVGLGDDGIQKIEWTVHLANKKAAWYEFSEHAGDLLIPNNGYEENEIPKRNEDVQDRQSLIIDPGPRTLASDDQTKRIVFSKDNIPSINGRKYNAHFPPKPLQGDTIESLGEIILDKNNNLLVLGGLGKTGGTEIIQTFGGAGGWHDDISDGPITCKMYFENGNEISINAWVIAGSPKFAPELVNITTLDDIMFSVAVRFFQEYKHNIVDEKYDDLYDESRWSDTQGWNPDYIADFERDIKPIIMRPAGYRWVANIPSMMSFSPPPFDIRDSSSKNYGNRKKYFEHFRVPGTYEKGKAGQQNQLFGEDLVPLMPSNAGSNAVSNEIMEKFTSLSRPQYFMLKQWSDGKFTLNNKNDMLGIHPLDRASVGNCAGAPMCPGIEVTWTTRNPAIYDRPYHILHRTDGDYINNGLDPNRDETKLDVKGNKQGCEPGDLTKRMATPWQADLFECTVEFVTFKDVSGNPDNQANEDENAIPRPPTYLAYWWPPQSPWDVINGDEPDPEDEENNPGVPVGQQVNFMRGINSHIQAISAWSYLGFIVNQAEGESRSDYAYFVEKERNHKEFGITAVGVDNSFAINNPLSTSWVPAFYLKRLRLFE